MKRRSVRPDDVLTDEDEIVVRGGVLDPANLRSDARRMFDVYGMYGISVFALRGATVDELAQRAPLVRFAHLTLMARCTPPGCHSSPPGATPATTRWSCRPSRRAWPP